MRKWIALLLTALMLLTLMPAYAYEEGENVMDLTDLGLYAEFPDAWMDLIEADLMYISPNYAYLEGYGVVTDIFLLADGADILAKDADEEAVMAWYQSFVGLVLSVAVLPEAGDPTAFFKEEDIERVGAEGGYAFYFIRHTLEDAVLATIPYTTVIAEDVDLNGIFTFSAPNAEYIASLEAQNGNRTFGEDGMFNGFSAIDLDSNVVTDAVFQEAKLTVVNIWGTFCSPCIKEMPFLGELATEYADKGLQIIGLLCDVVDNGAVNAEMSELAKTIVSRTKADYLHLLPTDEVLASIIEKTVSVPTTYFINAQGNLVGDPVVGSRAKDDWAKLFDARLTNID